MLSTLKKIFVPIKFSGNGGESIVIILYEL